MNCELFVPVLNFLGIRHGALTRQLQVLSHNGSTLKVQVNGCELRRWPRCCANINHLRTDMKMAKMLPENGHEEDLDGQNIVLAWE